MSSHAIEYGTTDFSSILKAAATAQTRNFIIILDDPVTAGILMVQGYQFGLFGVNTQILGSEEVTAPSLWQQMKKSLVKSVMQGYIGVNYSRERQLMHSSNIITYLFYIIININ